MSSTHLSLRSVFGLALALSGVTTLSAQNLISNGSFENPALSAPGTIYQLPRNSTWLTDWLTPTSADGSSTNTQVRHRNDTTDFSASHGTHFVGIGSAAYVSQSVELFAGQSYLLTFDIINASPSSVSLDIIISGGEGDFFSDNFSVGSGATYAWLSESFSFTAAFTDDYEFKFVRTSGTVGLDNVSLTAVPEPAAFGALAGVGALGFAALRRRRRVG